jgi:predicted metalloprotease with PDZ domain
MEHRNSTSLTSTRPLSTSTEGLLGTVAHEFFHSWNVERIRPKTLEPFDFTQANMSGELWLAEGFTNYYGDLAMRRAGFDEDAPYAQSLGRTVNAIINSPGRRYFSAADMSRQAPFVDAAQSIDLQNKSNTFISYYTFGEGIAAGLDLTLRSRFQNISLDDFMRAMWRKYGKTEKAYTQDDVQATLGEVTGDATFAADYVRRYIAGREVPDYAALFATVGMRLRPARPGLAWLGDVALQNQGGGVTLGTATLVGQPLYQAGLDRGDVIRSVDGRPLTSTSTLDSIVAAHKPGEALGIEFESRGAVVKASLTLRENPRLELVLLESIGETPSPAAMAARRRWLDSKATNAGAPK